MDEIEQALNDTFDLEQIHDVDSIEPARACMDALGNPQQEYYSFHVAGTNGKGSTCTFLARALEQAGYTVGLYIHPHLTDYRERFRINGEPIGRDRLFELAEVVAEAGEPSSYEFSTGIAFRWFAEEDVDVAVIETGLGGRLDATNTMTADVDIITPIGMDHSEILGDSIEEIAAEKAAIIDEGAAVVTSTEGTAASVVKDYADRRNASYHRPADMLQLEEDGLFYDAIIDGDRFETQIVAPYQQENINTAIRALQVADLAVSETAIKQAIEIFAPRARMQQIETDPMVLVDGAHNRKGMEAACDAFKRIDKPITAVFGVMKDKDHGAMLERLSDVVDKLILTEPSPEKAASPEHVAKDYDGSVVVEHEPDEALRRARSENDGGVIVVTGSLYLIGDLFDTVSLV